MRSVLAGALALPLLWSTIQPAKALDGAVADVEHGRYIVERVAMCFECHTPRDEAGRVQRGRWLLGAPVPVAPPPFERENWAIWAPRIAGMPGYTKEEGVRLLTQGVDRTGQRLRPPMPPFRLSTADAQSVVAYLKALGAPAGP
jgi:mono/diheme cytochrome c family protein